MLSKRGNDPEKSGEEIADFLDFSAAEIEIHFLPIQTAGFKVYIRRTKTCF